MESNTRFLKRHIDIGPLFTDLYELTMAAAYIKSHLNERATFSLFIRGFPHRRNYYVAAGLEDVLLELQNLSFSASDLAFLKSTGYFDDQFLTYLKDFRFSGDIHAVPEGTVFFAEEPILEVSAPLIEAQVIETFLLNTIGFQTLIATKAARCIHAARGRTLIDFSLRRTQGIDAGMKVARSTYLTGFAATSNVLAGKVYGIPISGTMAHSFVQAFPNEQAAFRAYAAVFPEKSVFLIDTYDTLEGARQAVRVAKEMRTDGAALIGIRLDSGDMVRQSRQVRRILDQAGLSDVKIFASSGFDEYSLARTIDQGAAIDAFGVGTKVGVSADAPYVDIVYKLVRYADRNVRKLSPGKQTLAGQKQVYRVLDSDGRYKADFIGIRHEDPQPGVPVLISVMQNGRILGELPSLDSITKVFRNNFENLKEQFKKLDNARAYPVHITAQLAELQNLTKMP